MSHSVCKVSDNTVVSTHENLQLARRSWIDLEMDTAAFRDEVRYKDPGYWAWFAAQEWIVNPRYARQRSYYLSRGLPRPTYRVLVEGAAGVGKTSLVNSFVYARKAPPVVRPSGVPAGVAAVQVTVPTSYGPVTLELWELPCGSTTRPSAHGLLVVYDLAAPSTLVTASDVLDESERTSPGLARVLCGSKADLAGEHADSHKPYPGVPHFRASARRFSRELPFLELVRRLTGFGDLVFETGFGGLECAESEPEPDAAVWEGDEFDPVAREFTYQLGPNTSYDHFGESVRDDLEDVLEGADCTGYDTVVRVLVTHRKRGGAPSCTAEAGNDSDR
jgi:hypothetical protein